MSLPPLRAEAGPNPNPSPCWSEHFEKISCGDVKGKSILLNFSFLGAAFGPDCGVWGGGPVSPPRPSAWGSQPAQLL